jgi:hypothetical protein
LVVRNEIRGGDPRGEAEPSIARALSRIRFFFFLETGLACSRPGRQHAMPLRTCALRFKRASLAGHGATHTDTTRQDESFIEDQRRHERRETTGEFNLSRVLGPRTHRTDTHTRVRRSTSTTGLDYRTGERTANTRAVHAPHTRPRERSTDSSQQNDAKRRQRECTTVQEGGATSAHR